MRASAFGPADCDQSCTGHQGRPLKRNRNRPWHTVVNDAVSTPADRPPPGRVAEPGPQPHAETSEQDSVPSYRRRRPDPHKLWRQRVGELQCAGVLSLQNRQVYERALACAPHAFAYAGPGKVCRLLFCPFCHAADAAVAYERVRRAIERDGKDIGFLLGQRTRRLALDVLQAGTPRLLDPPDGARGLILKDMVWPAEDMTGKVILAERVLSAVPASVAKAALSRPKKVWEAAKKWGGHGPRRTLTLMKMNS